MGFEFAVVGRDRVVEDNEPEYSVPVLTPDEAVDDVKFQEELYEVEVPSTVSVDTEKLQDDLGGLGRGIGLVKLTELTMVVALPERVVTIVVVPTKVVNVELRTVTELVSPPEVALPISVLRPVDVAEIVAAELSWLSSWLELDSFPVLPDAHQVSVELVGKGNGGVAPRVMIEVIVMPICVDEPPDD